MYILLLAVSLVPHFLSGLKQFFRSKKPKQPKSRSKFSFPPLIFPLHINASESNVECSTTSLGYILQ